MSHNHEAKRDSGDHGQRSSTFRGRGLGWLALVGLAVFPFPWW